MNCCIKPKSNMPPGMEVIDHEEKEMKAAMERAASERARLSEMEREMEQRENTVVEPKEPSEEKRPSTVRSSLPPFEPEEMPSPLNDPEPMNNDAPFAPPANLNPIPVNAPPRDNDIPYLVEREQAPPFGDEYTKDIQYNQGPPDNVPGFAVTDAQTPGWGGGNEFAVVIDKDQEPLLPPVGGNRGEIVRPLAHGKEDRPCCCWVVMLTILLFLTSFILLHPGILYRLTPDLWPTDGNFFASDNDEAQIIERAAPAAVAVAPDAPGLRSQIIVQNGNSPPAKQRGMEPNGLYEQREFPNGTRYWDNPDNECQLQRNIINEWDLMCNDQLCYKNQMATLVPPQHDLWKTVGCTMVPHLHYVRARLQVGDGAPEPLVPGIYYEQGMRGGLPWYKSKNMCEVYFSHDSNTWELWCFSDIWCQSITPLYMSPTIGDLPPDGETWQTGKGRAIGAGPGPRVEVFKLPSPEEDMAVERNALGGLKEQRQTIGASALYDAGVPIIA